MAEVETGAPELAGAAAEELGDFARVGAMVGDPEAGAPGAPEPAAEAPRMDATESLTGLLSLVGTGADMAGLPAVAVVWSPDACGNVAGAAVPVLRKYPWGARILDFLESGTGAEEAVLLVAVVGMGKATLDAYKRDTEKDPGEPVAALPVPVKAPAGVPDLGGMVEVHGRANG